MKKTIILALLFWMTGSVLTVAQQVVKIGKGSYASYTPLSMSRTNEHGGDQSQYMQYRRLYINESADTPIPTNKWWTDLINADRYRTGDEVTGHLWAYPGYVQGMKYGMDIHYPKYWVDNGTEMKAQSKLVITGTDFHAETPLAEAWSDWTVTFSESDGNRKLTTTLMHGSPFTWIEVENITLSLTAQKTNNNGADNKLTGETSVSFIAADGSPISNGSYSQFIIKIANSETADLYGIYLPMNTTVTFADGRAMLTAPYMVVALLKSEADLDTYSTYAYSKPTNTQVSWNYTNGLLTTNYHVTANDLRTGSATNSVLQGFIPHHYRERYATHSLTVISSYDTPRGLLKLAAGSSQSISYKFAGMLPWYALPTDGGEHAFDKNRMLQLVSEYASEGTFGADTYWGGKGLTQMALNMTFARELGDEALFDQCHARLKETLVNWLTYTPGEDNFFFARDNRWGGLIGYATSYDSDTYNDHHFHYGYFTLAAALLAMVDDDFRVHYGDMMKLVARDYANYKRDSWACFLRMYDPWEGHSYAGGMGDGAGNGQESTSEAMQGWGGLYLLGVALGDDEMRDAGIFGWVNESRATAEYWFDRHGETVDANFHTTKTEGYNIDYDKFKHTNPDYTIPYNSNLTSHGVGWWTWFGGDPVFMQGIQWMPVSPALDYLGEDKAFAAWDYQRLMELKEHKGWDGQGGIGTADLRDSDWGNVVLSYRQFSDPDDAAAIFDQGWENNWPTMKTSSTRGITYYVTHAHRTYGDIDWTVTASIPTARKYANAYIAYNPTNAPLTVTFSDGTNFVVPARQMKVKDMDYASVTKVFPVDNSEPDLREELVMPNLALGKSCTVSSWENVGCVAQNAIDGDKGSRWGSAHQDGEWIYVDLGESCSIYKVRIAWETAYASEYDLFVSDNTTDWTLAKACVSSGGQDEVLLGDVNGRYLKLLGKKRATQYGISLYEMEVYGKPSSAASTELMGVKISSPVDVLKQGVPTTLSIVGYDYAKTEKEVSATWSSTDGTFEGSVFTPTVYGKVNVTASVAGMTATKQLVVEEALRVTSIAMTADSKTTKDATVNVVVEAQNQFGQASDQTIQYALRKLTATGVEETTDATLTEVDNHHLTFRATKMGQYAITATCSGVSETHRIYVADPTRENLLFSLGQIGGLNAEATAPRAAVLENTDDYAENFFLRNDTQERQHDTYFTVDLIDLCNVEFVNIAFSPALPADYTIAVSADGTQWQQVCAVTDNTQQLCVSNLTGVANGVRYVKFHSTRAATDWGEKVSHIWIYGDVVASGGDIMMSNPDNNGRVVVTTRGGGITDSNKADFVSAVAALPNSVTALDLSDATLNYSGTMTLNLSNPNAVILVSGQGNDNNATSPMLNKIGNDHHVVFDNSNGWATVLNGGHELTFIDGYAVYPITYGGSTILNYSRTIPAGSYVTVSLPVAFNIPSGLIAYELSSVSASEIQFARVESTVAHKPYLIHNNTGTSSVISISHVAGNVVMRDGAGHTQAGNVTMEGSYRQFSVDGTEGYAAFRSNGQLAWLSNSGTTIGSFHAYLKGVSNEQMSRDTIASDEVPTGISDERSETKEHKNRIFDLQGRQINNFAKGIYVRSGKKMVVR